MRVRLTRARDLHLFRCSELARLVFSFFLVSLDPEVSMLKIFSVKDVKADAFLHPFLTHNSATAEREFRRMVLEPQSNMFHNPQDFELYEVGNWNDEVGVIVSRERPELVIRAESIRNLSTEGA